MKNNLHFKRAKLFTQASYNRSHGEIMKYFHLSISLYLLFLDTQLYIWYLRSSFQCHQIHYLLRMHKNLLHLNLYLVDNLFYFILFYFWLE